MTQKILLGVSPNPDDNQTLVIQAVVQLETDGEWFMIHELPDLAHEIDAYDLAEFHNRFKDLAKRINAEFDGDEILSMITEINEEDRDED